MQILVVDNNDGVRELVSEMFCALGHHVTGVNTGEVGLRVFSEFGPDCGLVFDLVVTDLEMLPGMNGIELAGAIRTGLVANDVPIVLVSGMLPPPEGIPYFVDFALSKPFNLAEIEQILEAVAAPVDENAHVGTDQMLQLGFVTKDPAHAAFRLSSDGFRARRHLQGCRECGERYVILGESVAFSA